MTPMLSETQLESICHRLGLAAATGSPLDRAIDDHRNELPAGDSAWLARASEQLREGQSLADTLRHSGQFPPLAVGMIAAGEQSGRLEESLVKLSEHYRRGVSARRRFVQSITRPLLQLLGGGIAIVMVFVAFAYLRRRLPSLHTPDLLGLGLSPLASAAVLAVLLIAATVGAAVLLTRFTRRGIAAGGGTLIASILYRIPILGGGLRQMAASRFAWAFASAIDAGLDAKRSIELGLHSGQPGWSSVMPEVDQRIERGETFYETMRCTGVFDTALLRAVQMGEATGTMVESLRRAAAAAEQAAIDAIRRVGHICGLIVTLGVLGLLGGCVVSMYAGYMTMVDEALRGTESTSAMLQSTIAEALSSDRGAGNFPLIVGDASSRSTSGAAATPTTPEAANAMATLKTPGQSETAEKSENSIIATRDAMVEDFRNNNRDFQQIESIYTHLSKFGTMSNDDFLDGFGNARQTAARVEKPADPSPSTATNPPRPNRPATDDDQ